MRSGALAALLGLVVLVPALTRAQEREVTGTLSLSWARGEGAEACPDARALAERIAHRLGADPFVAPGAGAPRSLEGWVEQRDGGLVATLVMRSGDGVAGSRVLRSGAADCTALAASVVLAAALAIDPEASLRPDRPAGALPETVRDTQPEAAAVQDTVPATPPEASQHDALAALVAIEGGILLGPLRHVAPALGLRAAVRFERTFALEARAAWSPSIAGDGFAFGASLFGVAGALALADGDAGRVELAVGAVLGVTDAHALPDGGRVALGAGPFVWGGPALGVRAELALGVARAGLAVDAIAPLPGRVYAIEGSERVVHEAPPIALAASLFVGVEVP